MKTKTVIQALSVVCLAGNLLFFSAVANTVTRRRSRVKSVAE